ncbi:MAG TPA: beta-ribofuranosylaminobenzene 5'-phosphate synthase family protein [Xanthobacteraceae bacterium]|nr:beta-ribofuranosylaminobenzene 5'-phosphate synthase family protein [Xanthobacteraceae bacterium]
MNRSPSPASVTVTVPARLHLGFLDLNGGLGRRFGSIGLAINGLKTSITFNAASQPQVTGPESERVRGYLQAMQRALDIENTCHVRIDEVVPAHAGLGSGTQIALAVAAGVRRFHGLPLDVRGDAIRLERGARSGVGIGLFDHGGLVVDGGRGPLTTAAPVVSRMPFPEQWRILVVLDPHRQGVHGPDEREVFSKLAPSSDGQAAHLCRLVLMKALPALAERDIAGFGSAINEMQVLLGDYFAAIQGGSRFSSPDVAAALAALEDEGAYGIGQSSWGPTGFAFAPSAEEANRLVESIYRQPRCRDLDIRTVAGLNRGAHIVSHVEADEPERHQR